MEKHIEVQCECLGTGYITVPDSTGDDYEAVECATHNEAYQERPTIDELLTHLGKVTGLNLK